MAEKVIKPQIKQADGTMLDVIIDSASVNTLKDKPTFDPTKQYILCYVANEDGTDYELKWVALDDADAGDY